MYEDYRPAFKASKLQEGLKIHSERFEIFSKKVEEVSAFNAQDDSWTKGINKFSDMTDEEFSAHYHLQDTTEQKCSATTSVREEPLKDVPSSFDWRDYGVVTPVKSQGHCGSCWTFSTVGALESHYYIATAQYKNFSEQALVDCARDQYECYGCKGGLPSYAFNFIRDHGLPTNETYPYRAEDGNIYYS